MADVREEELRELYALRDTVSDAADLSDINNRIKKLQSERVTQQKTDTPFQNYGAGLINSLGQGAMTGTSDEVGGMGETLNPFSDDPYEMHRDYNREGLKQFGDDYPFTRYGGDMLGSVIPGAMISNKFKQGASAANKVGQLMKEGSLIGGAEGYGRSEETSDPGKLADTVQGGILGSLFNLGGAGVAKVGGAAGQGIASLWRRFTKDEAEMAEDLILQTLKETNLTPEQVETALSELGPEATFLDLNNSLRALAAAAMKKSNSARQDIGENIVERQGGAYDRTKGRLEEASDAPTDFNSSQRQLETDQSASSNILYSDEMKGTKIPRGAIAAVLDNKQAKSVFNNMVDSYNTKNGTNISIDDPEFTIDFLDKLKRSFDQSGAGSPLVAKDTAYGDAMDMLARKLRTSIDNISGDYKAARQDFQTRQEVIDAGELGSDVLSRRGGQNVDDVRESVSKLTTPEQNQQFRQGATNTLIEKIPKAADANKARPFLADDPQVQGAIDLSTGGNRADLDQGLLAENTFAETNRLLNPNIGTKTSFLESSDEAFEEITSGMLAMGTGDPGSIATTAMRILSSDGKMSTGEAAKVAEMLVDPTTTLNILKERLARERNLPPRIREYLLKTWEIMRPGVGLGAAGETTAATQERYR